MTSVPSSSVSPSECPFPTIGRDGVKAAVYYGGGEPEVFTVEQVEPAAPAAGEIRIEVTSVAIEGADLARRRTAETSTAPQVVGYSASGRIVELGEGVSHFQVGQSVATFNWSGAYAQERVVPASFAYAVPKGVDDLQAAAIPVAFGTAFEALFERGRVRSGETVFVRGATGGVGVAAVQLARDAGANVIATASDDARAEQLRMLGANHVVDGRRADLESHLAAIAGGGVQVILDLVGGDRIGRLVRTLGPHGRYIVAAVDAEADAVIDVGLVLREQLSISGVLFGRELHKPRAHAYVDNLFQRVVDRGLSMPIAKTFALEDAAAAHRYIETEHPLGRVVLVP
jgi:NADPH:quinone reductase